MCLHSDHCRRQLVSCQSQVVQAFFTLVISMENTFGFGKQPLKKEQNKQGMGHKVKSIFPCEQQTNYHLSHSVSGCIWNFKLEDWRGKHLLPAKTAIKMNAWCLDNVINACPCCNAWRAKQQNNAEQHHTANTWLAINHHPSSIQLLRQSKGLV